MVAFGQHTTAREHDSCPRHSIDDSGGSRVASMGVVKRSGHRRSNRRVGLLAVTLLAVLGGSVLTTPAARAQSFDDAKAICPNGSTCLWSGAGFETGGYTGRYRNYFYYIPDFSAYNYSGTSASLANSASSVVNDGYSEWTYLYTGTYKTGSYLSLNIGVGADLGSPYNDNLESGYYASCLDGVC